MLLVVMELKGRVNSKIVRKAKCGDVYFDELGAFESVEKDRVTGSVSSIFYFIFLTLMCLIDSVLLGYDTQSPHYETHS